MSGRMTRKKFLKVAGVGAAAAATAPMFKVISQRDSSTRKTLVRIRPIVGKHYSPSFLRFCQRTRFQSVQEAVSKIKDRSIGCRLIMESV